MAARVAGTPQADLVVARLDDIAALLAVLVKRDRPNADVIADLAASGLGRSRIAELVGTSPGYVDNVIVRRKQAAAKVAKTAKPPKAREAATGESTAKAKHKSTT